MDFNNFDPTDPLQREKGYRLMVTMLVNRLGGYAEFTEAEVLEASRMPEASVGRREDEVTGQPILTFKTLPQVEADEENKRNVKELLKSFGLPAAIVDKAVDEAHANIERERLERQFKL